MGCNTMLLYGHLRTIWKYTHMNGTTTNRDLLTVETVWWWSDPGFFLKKLDLHSEFANQPCRGIQSSGYRAKRMGIFPYFENDKSCQLGILLNCWLNVSVNVYIGTSMILSSGYRAKRMGIFPDFENDKSCK